MPAKIKKENGTVTVTIHGDIDHHAAKELRFEIDAVIDEEIPDLLIMDLKHCDFMDSSGLGLILGRYRKCCEHGCDFRLANPGNKTMRILSMAGVENVIKTEASPTE
ncbi:MAG: STAS domain-containing protein [Clostridia bacterium]|nr:STAS domain-containing protein [Clostridia bacterium]